MRMSLQGRISSVGIQTHLQQRLRTSLEPKTRETAALPRQKCAILYVMFYSINVLTTQRRSLQLCQWPFLAAVWSVLHEPLMLKQPQRLVELRCRNNVG